MKFTSLFSLFVLFCFLSFCSSCAPRGTLQNAPEGESTPENTVTDTAVIFATSDLEGNVLPSLHAAQGGIASLKAYYKTAEADLKNQTIWLDGGHLMSDPSQASIMEKLGISATLAGLASSPTSLSRKGKITTASFKASDVKIGVIGLDTLPSQELDVEQLKTFVGDQSALLRKNGEDAIVLLSDLPISCLASKIAPQTTTLRKANEPQGFCEGPLAKLIEQLPEGTVDAVIVSGAHQEIHHFIFPRWSSHPTSGVPVVSSSPRGGSANLIFLSVGSTSGHRQVVSQRTRIEGPIAIQVQGRFHGKTIAPDPAIEALVAPLQAQRDQESKQMISNFTSNLELNPRAESSLTDFVADVILQKTHVDAVIAPLGLVRYAEFPKIAAGGFSRADLNALFPVPILIVSLEVRGDELKTLLKLSETGFRGFSSVAGIQLRLLSFDAEAPVDSKLSDSRTTLDRLLGADIQDDTIQSNKKYKIAVPLALVQGADDWEATSKSLGLASRVTATSDLKELVGSWLALNPSVNPPAPRLRFEKSRKALKKTKHRAKRRKTTH